MSQQPELPKAINRVVRSGDSLSSQLPPFATKNPGRVAEIERILGELGILGTGHIGLADLKLPEIQSGDPITVATEKAKEAYRQNGGRPVIVENTSLSIKDWDNLPGPFADQFTDTPSKRKILVANHAGQGAVAQVTLALWDGRNDPQHRVGKIAGRIAPELRGNNGFGWDDIFIPDGQKVKDGEQPKTFAEMTSKEKDQFSMRELALKEMAEKPFLVEGEVLELPEPPSYRGKLQKPERVSLVSRQFARDLEVIPAAQRERTDGKIDFAPYHEKLLGDGTIKRYVLDPSSPSGGLIITPIDLATDSRGKPKRINQDTFGNPIFWQMGERRVKDAVMSRQVEFDRYHNKEFYTQIRMMVEEAKENKPLRSNKRSPDIEELLGISGIEMDDGGMVNFSKVKVKKTSMGREFTVPREYSNKKVSRSAGTYGSFSTATGIPSSVLALGGMPPVTGSVDVVTTAAMSFMRSWIPRNGYFAHSEKQVKLFEASKKRIESYNLPDDIKDIVLRQIGVSVGGNNVEQTMKDAQAMYDVGCRSFRIYTTNPGIEVVDTARALRKQFGEDITICVGPIADIEQAIALSAPDVKVNELLAGHGGGENCTSLSAGGSPNSLELAYLMSIDTRFNHTSIGLEGGTGEHLAPWLPFVDKISKDGGMIAGVVETTGGLFIENTKGDIVTPYHGSASPATILMESLLYPELADTRVHADGQVKHPEGKPGYSVARESVNSVVQHFVQYRDYIGRILADAGCGSMAELRGKIAKEGYNYRHTSAVANTIANAHRGVT